ncbi:carbonic anhydrase family protein [Paucilactobacillus suebicus]|uniref:carbonic anhydrase n=1 Tax=Paucilactobacillus suebicus DSM 5007 = KCTC 3549 TaxID=1423807 RepID=A0A0R1WDY5_9LACO|nr:carbonic anhydrase family protein [Paucilactobacillus suebicus]KRM12995.1 carbonic anhydrase [Paucilactobacillus suebicus DSM 5007 = KCTC 3549]
MLDYSKQDQWTNGFGKQQSPIELNTRESGRTEPEALFNWQPVTGTSISDMEINFQVNGSGFVVIENHLYQFQQLHFHSPSEHQIDGHKASMEWHFVFQDQIGQLVVVARMAELGDSNPDFDKMLATFQAGQTTNFDESIEIQKLLPTQGPIFRYLGSLTTPPLTEGVRWYVDQTPLSVSQNQLDQYNGLFEQKNTRNLQELNDRNVWLTELDN